MFSGKWFLSSYTLAQGKFISKESTTRGNPEGLFGYIVLKDNPISFPLLWIIWLNVISPPWQSKSSPTQHDSTSGFYIPGADFGVCWRLVEEGMHQTECQIELNTQSNCTCWMLFIQWIDSKGFISWELGLFPAGMSVAICALTWSGWRRHSHDVADT